MQKTNTRLRVLVRGFVLGVICYLAFQSTLLSGRNEPVVSAKGVQSLAEAAEVGAAHEVWLCRRLVDDWRVQLLLPGVEHYSIWLPQKKLHRGAMADGLGQPLHWVDEMYLSKNETEMERLRQGFYCQPIPGANTPCVEGEVTRQRDEGPYSLWNHCQHKAIGVLARCGGEIPPLSPFLVQWLLKHPH